VECQTIKVFKMPAVFTPNSASERTNLENTASFDAAVTNRDPKALIQVAQNSYGTPMSEVALETAKKIDENQRSFNDIVAPLEAKGGASTPEGRQEVVKIWKNTTENPQWGTALVKYLLGDKAGAAKQITGGDVTQTNVFDVDGNLLQKRVNALGETLGVIDLKTGKPVLPEEYADRKVGFSAFGDTMAGKMAAISAEERAKSFVGNQAINNAWAAKFPVLGKQFEEIYDNLGEIQSRKGEISADVYAKVMQFSTRAQGESASDSEAKGILGQLTKNAGFRAGEQVSKSLASSFGVEGLWTFDGKGGIVNDKGQTKSLGELEQNTNSTSRNNERTESYNSIRADILKSAQLQGMSSDLQAKLLRSLELAQSIAKETSALSGSVGTPSFLSLPSAYSIENKMSQAKAQSLQGMFSAEAMTEYKKYYDDTVKHFKPGQLPAPNELEANFVKTKIYKDLQNKYAAKIKDTMNENRSEPVAKVGVSPVEKIAPSSKPLPNIGKAPPSKIPTGYEKIGKTPEGKSVYRTPEGKQVVEQ
tara:strand:+ start:609 stop:2207 length:1599 start_codon:yes stop_codon:yes gene_type:complete